MLRRLAVSVVLATCVGIGLSLGASAVRAEGDSTTSTVAESPEVTTGSDSSGMVTDSTSLSNFLTDLENDPSKCIGFNPPPNCGRKPTQAGDRGGALQYAVFGVMMAGLAVIGTVITRKIMARDRMIAKSLSASDIKPN